jgi:hypothetical protein
MDLTSLILLLFGLIFCIAITPFFVQIFRIDQQNWNLKKEERLAEQAKKDEETRDLILGFLLLIIYLATKLIFWLKDRLEYLLMSSTYWFHQNVWEIPHMLYGSDLLDHPQHASARQVSTWVLRMGETLEAPLDIQVVQEGNPQYVSVDFTRNGTWSKTMTFSKLHTKLQKYSPNPNWIFSVQKSGSEDCLRCLYWLGEENRQQ